MSKNYVVAVSRQYGSGGHEIGRKLADKLGIKFYDKELLSKIAKDSGMSKTLIEYYDEMPSRSLLFSLAMDAYPMSFTEMPINQKVFQAQVETIKKIAAEGPCVIIGRCADTILDEKDNVVSVFIHADMNAKVARVMERDGLSEDKARERIMKTDKKRASFYNFYSLDKRWGEVDSHDITLNSSKLGIEGSIDILYDYLKLRGFV
ncbi:MAG: cytidylate kinase-like family protein [Clostridia bacterium]|nr:cytidylate kinase-like family protein [Clostridia bacterium]